MGMMKKLALKMEQGERLTANEKRFIEQLHRHHHCHWCGHLLGEQGIREQGNSFCSETCRVSYQQTTAYQQVKTLQQ